jgi:hypothetical protein
VRLVYVDVGAGTAFGTRTDPRVLDLLFDGGRWEGVKKFEDLAAVPAPVGTESQFAVDCGAAPVRRPAVIANRHFYRPLCTDISKIVLEYERNF